MSTFLPSARCVKCDIVWDDEPHTVGVDEVAGSGQLIEVGCVCGEVYDADAYAALPMGECQACGHDVERDVEREAAARARSESMAPESWGDL